MRLLFISPMTALTYFSCYVNTFDSSSYLEVHVYTESGNLSGVSTEVWRTAKGEDTFIVSQKTDSDGRTTFELTPGTSEVRVPELSETAVAPLSQIVTLRAGETTRIELFHCSACHERD